MPDTKVLMDIFNRGDYKSLYFKAKRTRTCLVCGRQAHAFRCESSRLEYDVSALCEQCQEKYFLANYPANAEQ
jgi:hypothetical protein